MSKRKSQTKKVKGKTVRKTNNKKTNSKKKKTNHRSNNFQKILKTLEKQEKTLRNCIKNHCDNRDDLSEFQKSTCYQQKCEKEIEKYKQQKKEYIIANQIINRNSHEHYLNHMKHIMYMEEVEISIDNIIHQIKDDYRLDKSIAKMLIHFAKLPYTKKKERIDSLERLEKSSIV